MDESPGTVLVVDDEPGIRDLTAAILRREGIRTVEAKNGREALESILKEAPDAVLLDIRMPELDGMSVLRKVKELIPDLPVVVVTAFGDIPGAIEAVRAGAHDYLAKPFDNKNLVRIVRRALAERTMKRRMKGPSETSLLSVMGSGKAVQLLVAEVNRVARSDFSVVIRGETGSGKELVAQALHRESARAGGPFVPVDCGAIPENLIESELFGHERGSFTGAVAEKPGTFEVARGGTLFLDEIGNMPLPAQAKLLRVLQDRIVQRVGGTRPIKIDVRVVAATNLGLEGAVAAGEFRQDLYFRLAEFTIQVPSLRERREDIGPLAIRFASETSFELGKPVPRLSDGAMEVLLGHGWPGNVRQLRATVRRAVLVSEDEIRAEHLDILRGVPAPGSLASAVAGGAVRSLREAVREQTMTTERTILVDALRRSGGNKAMAARLLHIDYKTIHSKIKEYGITIDRE